MLSPEFTQAMGIKTFSVEQPITLHDCISQFAHVYMNDIFIYSHSIAEHKEHLRIIFQQLQDSHLFLSKSKVDLYSKKVEYLSHIIDNQGIHADADKM